MACAMRNMLPWSWHDRSSTHEVREPEVQAKARLKTVRTFDEKDRTRREKKCSTCGAQSFTLEVQEKVLFAKAEAAEERYLAEFRLSRR
jgi:transcriptional regulator NrdR family protein